MVDYWLQFWWLFPIALVFCTTACLVGIEGSVLFVPFFAFLFPVLGGQPLAPIDAVKIGLLTEVAGYTSSVLGYVRTGLIQWPVARFSMAVGIPFAIAGAFFTYALPAVTLIAAVGGVALLVGIVLLKGSPASAGSPTPSGPNAAFRMRRKQRALTMVAGGGLLGIVGFGTGVLGVSQLVLRGMPPQRAVATSAATVAMVAYGAAAVHLFKIVGGLTSAPWNILAINVAAVLIGGQIAARLAQRVSELFLRRLLGSILLLVAGLAAVRVVGG